MHIPSEVLSGAICPASAALAAAGVAAAAISAASRKPALRSAAKFALATALVFLLQGLNYPIFSGVSAHLLGGVLASALLGVGGGVLSVSLVVATQAFFFADGGMGFALGVNLLNMAVIGAGAGGLFRCWLMRRGVSSAVATGAAAALSVEAAALALSAEFALGAAMDAAAFGALMGLHLIAALIEGVATAALVHAFARAAAADAETARPARVFGALAAAAVICLALTPLASILPDAFEWTVERFGLAL